MPNFRSVPRTERMDYSYLQPHDRQESRPAPENDRRHPQNPYPVHCEHQQYPTGHQVMSTGYPSHGFASYIHPIQAPITSANAGMPSQEGLHPSRMMAQDSTSSSTIPPGMPFRRESERSMHLQHILHSVAHQPNLMQSDAVFHNLDRSAIIQHDPSRTTSGHSSYTVSSSVPQVRTEQPRPPVTSSVSSLSSETRPPEVSSAPRPLEATSEMDSKSCQTEPLFDMLPEAARTLSSSFDLMEGFSYKMTGEDMSPGVVVTKDLQEGEEFGPFTGEFVDDECGIIDPTSWEVCVRGKPGLYISGTCDPNNWMSHVQVARCREEQNMEAFQFYGDIFFRTTKAIEAGTELRVYYSKDYSTKVGFGTGLEELSFDQGLGQFNCRGCESKYSNAKSLLRHVKFEHDKENIPAQLARTDQHPSRKDKAGQSDRSILTVKQEKSSIARNAASREEKRKKAKSSDVSKRIQVKFIPPKMKKSSVPINKMDAQNRFSCSVCQKRFKSEGKLEAHSAFHKEVNASKRSCKVCGVLCQNVKALKQHEISHIPDAFQCHVCQRYFRMKNHMMFHLRHEHEVFEGKKWSQGDVDDLLDKLRVSSSDQQDVQDVQEEDAKKLKSVMNKKKRRPRCMECKQYFDNKETFEQHECREVTYKCQYCDKVFEMNSHRVTHLREEHKIYIWKRHSHKMEERLKRFVRPEDQTEEPSFHPNLPKDMLGRKIARAVKHSKMFKCKYCTKTYTTFTACSKHERELHTYSGNFMCEFCSASFVSETKYLMHKTKHTKERLYKCTECPLSYSSQGALDRHIRDHRGEYPHKCDVCAKGYRTRKNMLAHKRRTHEPPKVLFQCQFCPKKLKNKETHKAHENCHKGVRPYMCFTCSKAFRDSHSLKRHMLTHTGEKPHECKLCHKRFRVPHQLFQHMIIHGKVERHQAEKESEGPSTSSSGNRTISQVDQSSSIVNLQM